MLCSDCYNAEDHVGHQVSIYISEGGGVCDCGDDEAWLNKLSCKYNDPKNFVPSPIPPDLESAILSTLETALDFVIDVFSRADLTTSRDNISDIKVRSLHSMLSAKRYGSKDHTSDKYALVIWNDPVHTFDEVQELVKLYIGEDDDFSERISHGVDQYGRGLLKVSDDLPQLKSIKRGMERTGLVHTIRNWKDYFREEMCDAIINWVHEISKMPIHNNFTILGELVSKALCGTWRSGLRSRSSFGDGVSSSLDNGLIPAVGEHPPLPLDQSEEISDNKAVPSSPPAFWLQDGPRAPSSIPAGELATRVQYLIFFDARLWRSLRRTLLYIYISALVPSPTYKPILAQYFAEIFTQICDIYMFSDREKDASIIDDLTVQLFTTPSVATNILSYNYFSTFLAPLYTLTTQGCIGSPSCVSIFSGVLRSFDLFKHYSGYVPIFHALTHLVARSTDKGRLAGDANRIRQLGSLLRLFQGASPKAREHHEHVAYDSRSWIGEFQLMPYIYKIEQSFAVGIAECSQQQREQAIRITADMIYEWMYGSADKRGTEMEDPPFFVDYYSLQDEVRGANQEVQVSLVGLFHPIHAFLSHFIQHGNISDSEQLRKLLVPTTTYVFEKTARSPQSDDEYLYLLFDYALRVLVLVSQVKANLWSRNGLSLKHQVNFYRDSNFRDTGFTRDIFMAQTALVVLDPELTMPRLQYRFGLYFAKTFTYLDNQQCTYMLEDFIHYLIAFLIERTELIGLPVLEARRRYIRRRIIQCLGFKPLSFSDLCDTVAGSLDEDELFEIVLNELADFRPPVGVRDKGLFALKSEYMNEFDPFDIYFSSSQMDEAQTVLKKAINAQTKKPLEDIVLEPILIPITSGPFANLGAFTRTHAFADFVYQTLTGNALKEEHDGNMLLPLLLRLLHIAALDDLNRIQTDEPTLASVMCMDLRTPLRNSKTKRTALWLLYEYSLLPKFQSSKTHITRIIKLVHSKNPQLVQSHLEEKYGEELEIFSAEAEDNLQDSQNASASKTAAMKKMAMKKQKKILLKMQKKQKAFANKHKANLQAEDTEMEEETKQETSTGSQCIVCLTPCDSKSLFGVLGYVTKSNTCRYIPFLDEDWTYEAFSFSQNLDEKEPDVEPEGSGERYAYGEKYDEEPAVGPGFPSEYTKKK